LNAAEAYFVEVDYPVQEEEFPLSVVTLEVKASHEGSVKSKTLCLRLLD
jgi:hypothetical protein